MDPRSTWDSLVQDMKKIISEIAPGHSEREKQPSSLTPNKQKKVLVVS